MDKIPYTLPQKDSESTQDDSKSTDGSVHRPDDPGYVRQNDGVTKIEALCEWLSGVTLIPQILSTVKAGSYGCCGYPSVLWRLSTRESL